jgi:methylglutaconyl-CoA hydratase
MRQDFQTIEIERQGTLATVWLNRPQIHNALNETMTSELLEFFTEVNDMEDVRAVVLGGRGKSFCAGADLNWMRDVASYTYEQNHKESLQLANCFYAIYTCKKPTIAIVHGAAIGGANGLIAACDFAIADDNTVFCFSEVKIGIVPAMISPYVIKRVGESNARDLMLTGRKFQGLEAEQVGLINRTFSEGQSDDYLNSLIDLLSTSGPNAIAQCKNLINDVSNNLSLEQAVEYTANVIAEIRASQEGQEGMAAFLEKRKPNWVNEND